MFAMLNHRTLVALCNYVIATIYEVSLLDIAGGDKFLELLAKKFASLSSKFKEIF